MKKTVAVDVDGVLAKYDKWRGLDNIGDPVPGAVEFTKRLGQKYEVLIFTTRCSMSVATGRDSGETAESLVARVKAWLDKHGFHYDRIWSGQGKPLTFCIIDDNAIRCQPQADSSAFEIALGVLKA